MKPRSSIFGIIASFVVMIGLIAFNLFAQNATKPSKEPYCWTVKKDIELPNKAELEKWYEANKKEWIISVTKRRVRENKDIFVVHAEKLVCVGEKVKD